MTRPAVLIIEPDAGRRRELSRGLTEGGYEVAPATNAEEGERFARGLDATVIVAPADLARFGDSSILDRLAAAGTERTLVLLGNTPEEEQELPGDVIFLALAGLSTNEVIRRLCLVLIGRDLDVEPDAQLESLVGDLALKPLLELVREIHRVHLTGRLRFEDGAIYLERGEVIAAEAGPTRGLKAFCRLARLSEESFHIDLEKPRVVRDVEQNLNALVVAAIKDSLGEFPDPHARLSVKMGDDFFREPFTDLQQEILLCAHRGATVQETLDALPATDGAIVQELLQLENRGLIARQEVEPTVQVVTDSTADLPSALAREHGIAIVPLTVHFGDQIFHDRSDLQPGEFYHKLERDPAHPISNPPRPEDFGGVYRKAIERCDVVSVHISRKLSLTVERARQAAAAELRATAVAPPAGPRQAVAPPAGPRQAMAAAESSDRQRVRESRLEVVDGRQVSLGLGMLALFAARMAVRGESAKAIRGRLEDIRRRIVFVFVVDTLEYLAKGGRIGKARAFVGGLLRIKPILGLVDGEIEPLGRVMGRRAAYPRLLEILRQRLDSGRPGVVAIAHARAPVWADRLRRLVEERFEISELIMGEVGPVLGTHVGPGAFGVMVFQPSDEEAELIAPL